MQTICRAFRLVNTTCYPSSFRTTPHKPSSLIFSLFDDLLLLDTGKVRYSGPGRAAQSAFAARGFPCPDGFNIADFFMDLVVDSRLEGVRTD